jgi:hypothetical protein
MAAVFKECMLTEHSATKSFEDVSFVKLGTHYTRITFTPLSYKIERYFSIGSVRVLSTALN